MRIWGIVKGIATIAACLICGIFAYILTRSPVFDGDGYELYPDLSSSGNILATDHAAKDKLFVPSAGESARWEGDCSQELLSRFQAEIVRVERVCGVINYYCFCPRLGGGVTIDGVRVNLHVASNGDYTVAGTPLIFGGF